MEKVVALIEHEELILYTNDLLKDEVDRNRESKIAEGLNPTKKSSFGLEFPKYFSDYPELDDILESLKKANQGKKKLVETVENDIRKRHLRADILISSLLEKGTVLDWKLELEAAELRQVLRQPPGKTGSVGDAIHWLSLLNQSGNGNLHIVSLDADFSSKLDAGQLSDYLIDEWAAHKQFGKVSLHRSLSDFFKKQFPEINLSMELEKDELVERLRNSGSFEETHEIIALLQKFPKFTQKQIRLLFTALVHNSQVRWIGTDSDVADFFRQFETLAYLLDDDLLEQATKALEFPQGFFSFPF